MQKPPATAGEPVDVIVATHDRPELLKKTIRSIVDQTYAGPIRITVVFDASPQLHELEFSAPSRELRVFENARTRGLPGSRNTGLLAATAPIVAFCDDDDTWRPDKLENQLALLTDRQALGCVGGIEVHFGEKRLVRIPDADMVTAEALSGSRLTGAHPSTYLFAREPLLARVGLVDEDLPYGYGEDYDYLMRASTAGDVVILPQVTTDVLWHPEGSYFSHKWEAMADGLEYLMQKHPVITTNGRGNAWMEGQRAFALASLGTQPKMAIETAFKSIRLSAAEPRGYLALAVALHLVKPAFIVRALNRRGRGI